VSDAPQLIGGINCAALTPVHADLSPNFSAMADHCKWLLANGCNGLAVLGTTGEANSFSVPEKEAILENLAQAGIPGEKLIPGVGCCAIPDTVALTKKAMEVGAAGVLMLPPFYYKGVSDDGLFDAYSEVIDRVADSRLRVYLYHIPPISNMPLSIDLVGRLIKAYPATVVGLKDSGGVFDNMKALVDAYPGFAVLTGGDQFLLPLLRAGGAGGITAFCNIGAHLLRDLVDTWEGEGADAKQERISKLRETVIAHPQIPALRAVVANHTGDDGWLKARPPLLTLDPSKRAELIANLAALEFILPKAA